MIENYELQFSSVPLLWVLRFISSSGAWFHQYRMGIGRSRVRVVLWVPTYSWIWTRACIAFNEQLVWLRLRLRDKCYEGCGPVTDARPSSCNVQTFKLMRKLTNDSILLSIISVYGSICSSLCVTSNPRPVNPSTTLWTLPVGVTITATDDAGSKSGMKYFRSAAKMSSFLTVLYFSKRSSSCDLDTPFRAWLTKDSRAL